MHTFFVQQYDTQMWPQIKYEEILHERFIYLQGMFCIMYTSVSGIKVRRYMYDVCMSCMSLSKYILPRRYLFFL